MKIKKYLNPINYINKIRRPLILKKFRRQNKNTDFTIISQNCIGGVIYANLGLEFRTPTINMFIEDENFVKLVENFEYYMSIPAVIKTECFVDPIDSNIKYPVIAVGDIEMHCLHYHSGEEAVNAWERRRKRVNFNNVFVIGNSWNSHEKPEIIDRIANSKYKTVIFTYDSYKTKNCIELKGDKWKKDKRNIVRPNLTDKIPGSPYRQFEKIFDFVKWLNEK